MTDTVSNDADWPIGILVALRREELLSQGRHDAFLFVLARKGDVACVRAEIQATEEKLANPPDHLKAMVKPNASPRVHQDGYLAGLRDALKILTQPPNGSARDATQSTAQPPTEPHTIPSGSAPTPNPT
jgi:hypothetical protein